jgi:hypothetical protein
MKSYRHLYPQIHTWENLERAYRLACKGKRSHSPAADFEFNWEGHLLALQAELTAKSYRPGPYHSFYIHEPKKRLISAAPFPDRVVHHALCQIIEPILSAASSLTAMPTAPAKAPIGRWLAARTLPTLSIRATM